MASFRRRLPHRPRARWSRGWRRTPRRARRPPGIQRATRRWGATDPDQVCWHLRSISQGDGPPQTTLVPYVARHIAEESVRQTEAGWIWKFDSEMLRKGHQVGGLREAQGIIPNRQIPTVFIRCEIGMVTSEMVTDIKELFDDRATVIELASAGHHPMMDRPLSLVATLRAVLTHWENR